MADELQPTRFMKALGRLAADNKDGTMGTATHCLRSLAPDILTHELEFWLVLLRRWRKGGDEPALGAFVEVGFVPQMP